MDQFIKLQLGSDYNGIELHFDSLIEAVNVVELLAKTAYGVKIEKIAEQTYVVAKKGKSDFSFKISPANHTLTEQEFEQLQAEAINEDPQLQAEANENPNC